MTPTSSNNILLLILSICLAFAAIYTCNTVNQVNKSHTNTEIIYRTKVDSVERIVVKPYPVYTIDSIFVATNATIDTVEIIRQFLTSYVLVDSFRNEELALTITDSLKSCTIVYRQYKYKILRPDSIIEKTITINNTGKVNGVFTGIGIGFTGKGMAVIPKVAFQRSNFGIEAGFFLSDQPGIYAGLNWRIK